MREKIKTFFCVLILLVALPYIITMVLQGRENQGNPVAVTAPGQKQEEITDIEERLMGIIAGEIPITYEMESLKAQAVIARTNLLAALEQGEEPPETISKAELQKLWGAKGAKRNYQKLAEAIEETSGVILTYQGNYINAAFHAVSAGRTRSAAEELQDKGAPWLVAVDSKKDIPSPDYLKVIFLKKEELAQELEGAFSAALQNKEEPLKEIEVTSRDEGEYVLQIKIGNSVMTGEEFRHALGLNSSCFYLKEVEGEIRIVTKGLGHGYGMSQYGANERAKEGATYREILSYYFKNIEISD